MEESSVLSFALWAIITAIIMGVTGASYRAFMRRRKNEASSS
ncbi:MAG: hypothetical protein R3237_04820 [Nitrosopumilaceae archaeon]|nr:hypothetical protein [Nitrosopumilaceae archaeon]